jgi:hypothetical protein
MPPEGEQAGRPGEARIEDDISARPLVIDADQSKLRDRNLFSRPDWRLP